MPAAVTPRAGELAVIRFPIRTGHPPQSKEKLTPECLQHLTLGDSRGWHADPVGGREAFINRELPVPADTVETASLLVTLAHLGNSNAVAAITLEGMALLEAAGAGNWAALGMIESVILAPYDLIRLRDQALSPICLRLLDLLAAELLA